MSKTVVGVYETVEQARQVWQELLATHYNPDAVLILTGDPNTQRIRRVNGNPPTGQAPSALGDDPLAALKEAGVPYVDTERYRGAILQGSTLVMVATTEQRVDEAIEILNHYQPVEFAPGARQGHSERWAGSGGAEGMQPQSLDDDKYDDADPWRGAAEANGDWRPPLDATTAPGGTGHGHSTHIEPGGYTETGGREVSYAFNSTETDPPDFALYRDDFRTHYETHYAQTGLPFSAYEPAYRLGFELGNRPELGHQQWHDLEPEARRRWQAEHDGDWEQFADAVQRGWTWLRA
jgi:hypothetical protein